MRKKPSIQQVLVKLNEGVSGEGNAIIDLRGLASVAGSADSGGEAAPDRERGTTSKNGYIRRTPSRNEV